MNVYLKQIEQLLELQKVDDAIYDVNQDLKKAPLELSSLEERFAHMEEKRNKVVDKVTHIQEQQKRLAFEIENDVANIKKSKNKLAQVSNQREYHAMMREMDSMEKQNRLREEEKVVLQEEMQIQEEALSEIDRDYLALKAELEVRRESLQERIDKSQKKLDTLESERGNAGDEVPAPVFQRYEFIRHRLDHPVIVPVEAGICSGCNISIPPQSFIELQRGQQILSCPNCQRLVYWCEHFKRPESENVVEAAPAAPKFKFFNEDA